MALQTPTSPDKEVTAATAKNDSPTGSDDSLMMDAPGGYIPPDQQDMMLTDITSTVLHSEECTARIGWGKKYLSEAKSFPLEWPAAGFFYGINRRLMISLPCRVGHEGPGPNSNKVLNIFFLVDTGSPVSYLCLEATEALIDGDSTCDVEGALLVGVQNESVHMSFHLSPSKSHFHDVNVLGMDFLTKSVLCMTVDTPIDRFRLFKRDQMSMLQDYPTKVSE